MKKRYWLLCVVLLIVAAPTAYLLKYKEARIQCYFFPNGDIDKPQVLNACVASDTSDWKLPRQVHGFGVMPFLISSAKCGVEYYPGLFSIEKEHACRYFNDNYSDFLGLGEFGDNPVHELARRHNACVVEGPECFASQLRSIELLLERGLDIDIRKPGGRSALGIAAVDGNIELFRWLIEKGSDPTHIVFGTGGHGVLDQIRQGIEWCVEDDMGSECSADWEEILVILDTY